MKKVCTVRSANLRVYNFQTKEVEDRKNVSVPFFTCFEEGITAYETKNNVRVLEATEVSNMKAAVLTMSNEDLLNSGKITVKEG